VGRRHECQACLNNGYDNTGNWSPQTGNQHSARDRSNTLGHECSAKRIRSRAGHAKIKERSSGEQPLYQKTATGPSVREGREYSLHTIPLSAYEMRNGIETFDTVTRRSHFRGIATSLNFENPALQCDGYGVSAVVRRQLREDARDVAFDGFLADRKLRGDLFVGISRCDQPKNVEFSRR